LLHVRKALGIEVQEQNRLAQNQDNVPEWSDMSINGLMFL